MPANLSTDLPANVLTDPLSAASVYFAPMLPWQAQSWQQLTARYPRLPHALLFAGMQGIGKRAFVWRFSAWMLCERRAQNPQGACGQCQSCQWLLAGTHPDLQVLPLSSLPTASSPTASLPTSKRTTQTSAQQKKQAGKAASKKGSSDPKNAPKKDTIKIDDIRALQPFISRGSSGRRICVLDNAETMTLAAANALLKTLEEPRNGVHLWLISDSPAKLLPTINSRVQQIALTHTDRRQVEAYLGAYIKQHPNATIGDSETQAPVAALIKQTLSLANGAPLAALAMLSSAWYGQRHTWLTTWLALRVGKRSSVAASDYWQKILSLADFMTLSELMLMELSRGCMGMPLLQTDLDLEGYASVAQLNVEDIYGVLQDIDAIKQAMQQNVQDKLGYDRLFNTLATL